jgi:hypothetical protein
VGRHAHARLKEAMMSYFSDRDMTRTIAQAAKLRDWSAIDAVLEEQRLRGNSSVISGFRGARLKLGTEQPALTGLPAPSPVTIHDLPSLDGIEITGTGEGSIRTWHRKGERPEERRPVRGKKVARA